MPYSWPRPMLLVSLLYLDKSLTLTVQYANALTSALWLASRACYSWYWVVKNSARATTTMSMLSASSSFICLPASIAYVMSSMILCLSIWNPSTSSLCSHCCPWSQLRLVAHTMCKNAKKFLRSRHWADERWSLDIFTGAPLVDKQGSARWVPCSCVDFPYSGYLGLVEIRTMRPNRVVYWPLGYAGTRT